MASVSPLPQRPVVDVEGNTGLRVSRTTLTEDGHDTSSLKVRYVTYANIPCKSLPGPPIASLPTPQPRAAWQTTAVVGSPLRDLLSRPLGSSPQPSSSRQETTAPSSLSPFTVVSPAVSVNDKSDSAFQAAQQFLLSSGASLLQYANPSLYLPVRSGVETSAGTSAGSFEELSQEVQRNLLKSTTAAAALKERYAAESAPIATSNSTASRCGGVDWKKIEWVRQQCRYTGEALLQSPVKAAQEREAAGPQEGAPLTADAAVDAAPPLPSSQVSSFFTPNTTTATDSTQVEEKSVGTRLVQSLLHPFTQPTALATAAVEATGAAADDTVTDTVVPHGNGVMTYLLYCKPKNGDYAHLGGDAASENGGSVASPLAVHSASPFLPLDLIPTAYCPPLTEIESSIVSEDGPTSSGTGATPPAPPLPNLLLLSLIVYEGPFVHGKRHGRGRLTAYGRMVLECNWSEDVPSLMAPWPICPSARSEASQAPTLWNVEAHVWTPAAAASAPSSTLDSPRLRRAHKTAKDVTHVNEASQCPRRAPSGMWSVAVSQAYMGSLTLATVANKRLLAKIEACMGTPATPLTAKELTGARGTRYVVLPVPRPGHPSDRQCFSDAFRGLGWANHTVFLPDNFGEAHFRADGGLERSDAVFAASPRTVPSPEGPFHPPIWVPATSSAASVRHSSLSKSSRCWQYCGQWSAGLPHGFGAAAERLTDPTAGTVPPHYPWRTLFLGQHVKGKRHGPGTHHGAQGSEATGVVLCGTWPRQEHSSMSPDTDTGASNHQEQATANIVLLPASSPGVMLSTDCEPATAASSRPPPTLSSFFSLECARWINSETDDGGCSVYGNGSGGGFFSAAKLRQSSAALSGMWEPLFRDVDHSVTRGDPKPLFDYEDSSDTISRESVGDEAAAAKFSPSRKARLWWQACRIMETFVTSSECVVALTTFQAIFSFMYGADLAMEPAAREAEAASPETPTAPSGLLKAVSKLLDRLGNAATLASSSSAASSMDCPWCPTHSWCAMAHLGIPSASLPCTRGNLSYAGCLHVGLAEGATHRQHAPTHPRLGTLQPCGYTGIASKMKSARNMPLRSSISSVAAALEPFAAAHTFTHAVHAAAAFVSSLRLRLLSCFATNPGLCEVFMGDRESEDKILQYCWHVVFSHVGSVLVKKATGVAVADVRLVWKLLGLKTEECGKETLTDYMVALRRCRTLATADIVGMTHTDVYKTCHADISSSLNQCARRLGNLMGRHVAASPLSLVPETPTSAISYELQDMTTLLSQLHTLLGTTGHISGVVTAPMNSLQGSGVEGEATTATTLTPAHREALLRWTLLSAAVGPTEAASSTHTVPGRHPFAFLLIGHLILSGQVTPAYPIQVADSGVRDGHSNSGLPSRHDLLLLLKDIGRSTMELMHTYPCVRSWALLPSPHAPRHAWTMSAVCPLNTLALRLEYALSPCAALHLCVSSSSAHPISGAALGIKTPSKPTCTERGSPGGSGEIRQYAGAAPNDCTIYLSLQSLPFETLQWCQRELTERSTVALMEARLERYWRRLPPNIAQHPTHGDHLKEVDRAPEPRHNDTLPPSPLMMWLLACLQDMLSRPLLPQTMLIPSVAPAQAKSDLTQRHTSQAPSFLREPPSPTAPQTHYTWTKFVSSVFFSDAEKGEWTSTRVSDRTAPAQALSWVDHCYVIAFAYTLAELAGITMNLKSSFVFDDDDDDDDEKTVDAYKPDSTPAGSVGNRCRATDLVGSSLQMETPDNQPQCEHKNIFLSSSSLSSPASSTSLKPEISPGEERECAAQDVHAGDNSAGGERDSPSRCLPGNGDAATPTSRLHLTSPEASPYASVTALQCHETPTDNVRLRSQSAAAAGPVVPPMANGPVGKEWKLVLELPPDSRHSRLDQVTTKSLYPAFFSSLTWEVMEKVCSKVYHQLHATMPHSDAAENEKARKSRGAKSRP